MPTRPRAKHARDRRPLAANAAPVPLLDIDHMQLDDASTLHLWFDEPIVGHSGPTGITCNGLLPSDWTFGPGNEITINWAGGIADGDTLNIPPGDSLIRARDGAYLAPRLIIIGDTSPPTNAFAILAIYATDSPGHLLVQFSEAQNLTLDPGDFVNLFIGGANPTAVDSNPPAGFPDTFVGISAANTAQGTPWSVNGPAAGAIVPDGDAIVPQSGVILSTRYVEPTPPAPAFLLRVEYADAAGHLRAQFSSPLLPTLLIADFTALEFESGPGTDLWDPAGTLSAIGPVGYDNSWVEFEDCTFLDGSRFRLVTPGAIVMDDGSELITPVTGYIANIP